MYFEAKIWLHVLRYAINSDSIILCILILYIYVIVASAHLIELFNLRLFSGMNAVVRNAATEEQCLQLTP